jgi:NAD(P)-dependent dehydrogenase (short-subunit alcohol dehydrogenase family)
MLNSLIECSALELAPFGIRVNGVAPGMTETTFRVSDDFNQQENQDYLDKMAGFFLLNKQVLKPKDIVNAILFLASEQARFMTGEIMAVDNGYGLNHDLSFAPPEEE